MSTTYNIDFSEPIKAGFQIKAGAYNGPGGVEANTTLRLFGRGAREWGEAVDEDLVRLTENFASASSPSVAISGQMWVETTLYYRDTTVVDPLSGWYRFNLSTKTWALIGGTGTVSAAPMSVPTVGHYYASGGVLRGYYTLGKYEPAAYLVRASSTGNGPPGSLVPAQTLYVYDANANAGAGQWVPQSGTVVTNGPNPSNPRPGMLWYNTATGNLSVWTGSVWQNTVGPTNSGGKSTSSGILDMNNFRIINLANPTAAQDATTKQYVDAAVAAVSSQLGNYLPLTGGTLTGPGNLTVNGALNAQTTLGVQGAVTFNSTLNVGGTITGSQINTSGQVTVGNHLTVNGGSQLNGGVNLGGTMNAVGNAINNVGMDGSANGAATKSYADAVSNNAYNGAVAVANTKLASVAVSGPYLFGNGTGGSPVNANLGAIKSGIFSSLSCADALAMRNTMIACGYWSGGGVGGVGGTGTIGPL